jgi:uncharacterized surface protein with fasciclin (FAS1) repeats
MEAVPVHSRRTPLYVLEGEMAMAALTKIKIVDIIATAVRTGMFGTFIEALRVAELLETLRGPGPFTVFAPTDVAFAKLPLGALEALMGDPPRLRSTMAYHVVPGSYTLSQVGERKSASTIHGAEVRFDFTRGATVSSVRIVESDIIAINGVIHVVDNVLMPE